MPQPLIAAVILCLMAPANAVISATVNAWYAGFAWGLGNRSTQPELPAWATRLARSHANLIENLPSFLGLVLIGHVLGIAGQISVFTAWGFVACRIAFAITYTAGITLFAVRTLLYFASIGCLAAMAWQVLSAMPLSHR